MENGKFFENATPEKPQQLLIERIIIAPFAKIISAVAYTAFPKKIGLRIRPPYVLKNRPNPLAGSAFYPSQWDIDFPISGIRLLNSQLKREIPKSKV